MSRPVLDSTSRDDLTQWEARRREQLRAECDEREARALQRDEVHAAEQRVRRRVFERAWLRRGESIERELVELKRRRSGR